MPAIPLLMTRLFGRRPMAVRCRPPLRERLADWLWFALVAAGDLLLLLLVLAVLAGGLGVAAALMGVNGA